MKLSFASLLVLLAFAPSAQEPVSAYFSNLRQVTVSAPDRQNYIVVDGEIWNHARPDLADLRLYDNETQMPYELKQELGGVSSEERQARILNLGTKHGLTEFDLDVGDIQEYDRVRLQLDAKNFIVKASTEGANTLDQALRTTLGTSTLYDFSQEKLGSSTTLKIPPSSFRYLHVRLSSGLLPAQVTAAYVYSAQEKATAWTSLGSCHVTGQSNRHTEIACEVPTTVPLDRILFAVAGSQVNFRRGVSVADTENRQIASADISRIKINRAGTSVVSEELSVNVPGAHTSRVTVTIDNGDDPPLHFDQIRPQALERRLYFEPHGKTSFKLYYGDDKLTAPVYDYAKLFREDPAAVAAQLGPETRNPSYTARPDDRPWSERHKTVLWIAMLLAIVTLTVLAIQGLRSGPQTS
jgi:Protein of unknown function (DUF3999)